MADFPIPEGYYLLGGITKENARTAISEAQERGFGADTVRTRHDGFLIPLAEGEILNIVAETIDAPDKSWTNDRIAKFASDNGIDLGDATVKADMLAKITDAIPVMGDTDADAPLNQEEEGE